MPTPEAAHTAITSWFGPAFAAKIAARSLTVPIVWPGDKRSSAPTAPFARFAFQRISQRITDIGRQPDVLVPTAFEIEFREQVALEVRVADGKGDLQLDQITMDVMVLFAAVAWNPATVGGVRFIPDGRPESTVRTTTPHPDDTFGAHLKATVIAPYMFEWSGS